MNRKLNRGLVVAIAALSFTQLVRAQSSSASLGAIDAPESTMTKQEALTEVAKTTGTFGGVSVEFDRNAKQEGAGAAADTETTLSAGYKFSDDYQLSANQRIDYSIMNHEGTQAKAEMPATRVLLKQSNMSLLGAKGSNTLRLGLPTTRSEYGDNHLIAGISYLPDYTWELSPVWNIEYQGNQGVYFHSGPKTGSAAEDAFGANATASQRTMAVTENVLGLNYVASKQITVFQSFGHRYDFQNANVDHNKANITSQDDINTGWNVSSSMLEVSTGVNATLAKNLSAQLYAVQYVPLVDSETGAGAGTAIPYNPGYGLYRDSQTRYEAILSATF